VGLLTRWLAPSHPSPGGTVSASLTPATWDAASALSGYGDGLGLGIAVNRHQAMTVPAVARSRNLITGTIGHLPMRQLRRGELDPDDAPAWVAQPDLDVPRVSTLAWTVDDLLFHGMAAWQVTQVYAEDSRPRHARRIQPGRFVPRLSTDGYRVVGWQLDGQAVPPRGLGSLLVFHGVDEGVLRRAASTIRTAMELERAAYRYAETPLPSLELHNTGADMSEDKVDQLLARWKAARRDGSVGYTSAALEAREIGWDPKALQLVEARQHVAGEVSRLMGVPAYLIGAQQPGSSMTYSNTRDERQQLVDITLRPFLAALEQRLSMDDVTPAGTSVRFDLDDYLRADHTTRANYYTSMIAAGVMTVDEAREHEGLPALAQQPAPTPEAAP